MSSSANEFLSLLLIYFSPFSSRVTVFDEWKFKFALQFTLCINYSLFYKFCSIYLSTWISFPSPYEFRPILKFYYKRPCNLQPLSLFLFSLPVTSVKVSHSFSTCLSCFTNSLGMLPFKFSSLFSMLSVLSFYIFSSISFYVSNNWYKTVI